MKPTFSIKARAQARHQLGQAIEGVLSGLVALEARVGGHGLLTSLTGAGREAQTERLREVLDRDRALVAAGPPGRSDAAKPALANARPALGTAPSAAAAELGSRAEPPASTLGSRAEPPASTEPIRTRTMARLLAAQGHPARALAIYDALLATDSDPDLRAEAERLRSQGS
jgi:hypothetical protein